MLKLLVRVGRYSAAALSQRFDERADPKVQLEQAMAEAQQQHRRLREQAANVIANQKQTELQLNRVMDDLDRTRGLAQRALHMGDEEAALAFAGRLVSAEREAESLKSLHLQATSAAEQAKEAVEQNAVALQQTLAERQKLLSQLDQARMQEQMNRAVASLSEAVGQDVPTLAEVRDKIERRYAHALGAAEMQSRVVVGRLLEVERAQLDHEAAERLSRLRTELAS